MSYAKNPVDILYNICQVAASVAKLVLGIHFGAHLREVEAVGGQRWFHSKERWWFTIYICLQRSNNRNGYFGAKFWDGIDRYKPNSNTIRNPVVCKRNRVDIFCRLSIMHERDRQTDRQTCSVSDQLPVAAGRRSLDLRTAS